MSRAIISCLLILAFVSSTRAQEPKKETKKEIKNPALAKELARRFAVDQAARNDLIKFMAENHISGVVDATKTDPKIVETFQAKLAKVQEADRDNTAWLKEMIDKHGWPGKSLVGSAGEQNSWLLAQHADADREFQEFCLKKMQAMPKGEVEPRNIAYLTDRVLLAQGKKQKYGTQAIMKDGKATPRPLEDPEHVDQRRKSVGLQPLAEYLKFMEQVYGPKKDDANKGKEKGK